MYYKYERNVPGKFLPSESIFRYNLFAHIFYNEVKLYLCGTVAASGSTVHPSDDPWVNIEQWWSDTNRGKRKTGRKTRSSDILSTTNPTWTVLETNPSFCGDRPAIHLQLFIVWLFIFSNLLCDVVTKMSVEQHSGSMCFMQIEKCSQQSAVFPVDYFRSGNIGFYIKINFWYNTSATAMFSIITTRETFTAYLKL